MGESELRYDDRNLQRLFAEMDIKARKKALRGAFSREATKVRKLAIQNFRASIRSNKELERKGIKKKVFRRGSGFTVKLVGNADIKPVHMWAELGTDDRMTSGRGLYRKKVRSTGRMKRYAFMRTTRLAVKNTVTDDLHNEIRKNVIKVASKYGCK